jgi:hypothetical protein
MIILFKKVKEKKHRFSLSGNKKTIAPKELHPCR